MSIEQVEQTKKPKNQIAAFTLVETIIAMTLISVIFVMIMQAFNAILLGTYLVDARTAVRNESEFVSEYFKLRVKNADPRSIVCNSYDGSGVRPDNDLPDYSIYWQNSGSSTEYLFKAETVTDSEGDETQRFCLNHYNSGAVNYSECMNVLTYNDVDVSKIDIVCERIVDDVTRAEFWIINLNYEMSSTTKMGERAAVRDVPRHVSISIR